MGERVRGDGVRHSGSGVLRRDRASVPPLAAVEHFGEGEVCVIGLVCLSDALCDVVSSFVSLLSIDIPINTMHRTYQHHTLNLSTPQFIMSTEGKELTLFEKIAAHKIPSTIVYEDDQVRFCPHELIRSAAPSETLTPAPPSTSSWSQRCATILRS